MLGFPEALPATAMEGNFVVQHDPVFLKNGY
jgi:hypothetical protein